MRQKEPKMTCSPPLLEAYVDEELDAAGAAAVAAHLSTCAACAAAYAQLQRQQSAIRALPKYAAPPDLRTAIRRHLELAARESRGAQRSYWRGLAIAASLLLAASLAWNIAQLRTRPELLAQNIIDAHVRSLMGTHLLDVESTDQHTVKPWFNGRLDFSPDVKDLAAGGFPLLGGRVDYVQSRPVAGLVYQRRKHLINLFTWPASASPAPSRISRNGYNELHWTANGMTFFAVSDIAPAELDQFRQLLLR